MSLVLPPEMLKKRGEKIKKNPTFDKRTVKQKEMEEKERKGTKKKKREEDTQAEVFVDALKRSYERFDDRSTRN